METVLLTLGYWRTRHSRTAYNTIQYKREYYYSGINSVEFRGICTLIEFPFLELKPGLTRSHSTAERVNHDAAGVEMLERQPCRRRTSLDPSQPVY